jgi:hypothetical protein
MKTRAETLCNYINNSTLQVMGADDEIFNFSIQPENSLEPLLANKENINRPVLTIKIQYGDKFSDYKEFNIKHKNIKRLSEWLNKMFINEIKKG